MGRTGCFLRDRRKFTSAGAVFRQFDEDGRIREALTLVSGQSVRFASVRLRTFLPSRYPSRSRTAGREWRLRTISMYLGTECRPQNAVH